MMPTWLERQHRITRPDRVLIVTDYETRITRALGLSAGTLYLVARRLLLDQCGDSLKEGDVHELAVTVREFADRVGIGASRANEILRDPQWVMQRSQTANELRASSNRTFTGRTPATLAIYGLPPLLPVDQVAVHDALQARTQPGRAETAVAAVRELTALARRGWEALATELFTADPSPRPLSQHPAGQTPLPLLALVQRATGITPERTALDLIQATLELRTALRGERTEIPHYVIDHWLPEIGSLRFWVLVQVLRACQMSRVDQATLTFADLATRLGVNRATLYRLVADVDELARAYGAWAGTITALRAHVHFRAVAYSPEMTPLAPIHEGQFDPTRQLDEDEPGNDGRAEVPPESQKRTSVALESQKRTSAASPSRKSAHPQPAPESQKRTSVAGPGRKNGHRSNGLEQAEIAADGSPGTERRRNSEQEEKSHIYNESIDDFLKWQPYWPAMQGHAKLQRNRQVREKAGRALPLWVAAVLAQMASGMQDPVTLAVDAFDPVTSSRTVPYACLELGERGPLVTAQVLSRLAWPDLAWPTDPDLTRIEQGLLDLGAPTFRQAPPDFALAAIRLLAISQLAERLRKEATSLNGHLHETPVTETEPETRPAAAESELQGIWRRAVAQLRLELPRAAAEAWFAHAELFQVDESEYRVSVPTQYVADTLNHRAQGMVTRVLKDLTGQAELTITFTSRSTRT
jgi:plasmid maintenance system antidote protein VapI